VTTDVSDLDELLMVLQVVKMKRGMPSALVERVIGLPMPGPADVYRTAIAKGYCASGPTSLVLTEQGHAYWAREREREREAVGGPWMSRHVESFQQHNYAVKALVSSYQQSRNSDADGLQLRRVVAGLSKTHVQTQRWLDTLTMKAPRFGHYERRLALSLANAADGDSTAVASVLTDSYHTVWFEMHEDLLMLAGIPRGE
jgi:hypothetical protein